jgi:hypothetical protein
MDVLPLARHQWGDMYVYIYIYIYILSVSSSVHSLAAKARRLFVCVALASERVRQSFCRCRFLPLLLCYQRAVPPAAAAAAAVCALQEHACLSLFALLARAASRRVVVKPNSTPPGSTPLTRWFASPGLPGSLSADPSRSPLPGGTVLNIGHRKGNPCFPRHPSPPSPTFQLQYLLYVKGS